MLLMAWQNDFWPKSSAHGICPLIYIVRSDTIKNHFALKSMIFGVFSMACFHPNYGYFGSILNDGTKPFTFCGPLTPYALEFNREFYGDDFVILKCGKCRGCRLDHARQWADRMLLELDHSPEALFCTLTYDDQHLTYVDCSDGCKRPTLVLRDMQLFHKSLRKYFAQKDGRKLRMFYAGEYGETTLRPHYHAIYYNLNLLDFDDLVLWSDNNNILSDQSALFVSPKLNELWERGNVIIAKANYKTFGYVARYTLKKQFLSDFGSLYYQGRTPPFCHMSNRPGLGMYYEKDHGLEYSRVPCYDGSEHHMICLPRHVLAKLELTNSELYATIKADRQDFARSQVTLLENSIDLPYLDYLKVCESNFARRTKILDRKDVYL